MQVNDESFHFTARPMGARIEIEYREPHGHVHHRLYATPDDAEALYTQLGKALGKVSHLPRVHMRFMLDSENRFAHDLDPTLVSLAHSDDKAEIRCTARELKGLYDWIAAVLRLDLGMEPQLALRCAHCGKLTGEGTVAKAVLDTLKDLPRCDRCGKLLGGCVYGSPDGRFCSWDCELIARSASGAFWTRIKTALDASAALDAIDALRYSMEDVIERHPDPKFKIGAPVVKGSTLGYVRERQWGVSTGWLYRVDVAGVDYGTFFQGPWWAESLIEAVKC